MWPRIKLLLIFFIGLNLSEGKGQHTFKASIFNHAIALPGGSFAAPIHPGIDVGWLYPIRSGRRWDHDLVFQLGYYHQRLVHQGIQLFGEYLGQWHLLPGFQAEMGGGLGYLHTLPLHDLFELRSDGTFQQTGKWGKPHIQASVFIGFSLAPKEWPVRPFLQYRFRVMAPFVKEYVPLLPTTSLHVGTYFDINFKREQQ